MIIGLDIGYNAVKAVTGKLQATFPSVVGTPDTARFSIGASNDVLIEYNKSAYLVGESAVTQSRMTERREDRHWYQSDEYIILLLAALSSLNANDDVTVMTGLPVAFFTADKDALKEKLQGEYDFLRNGKHFSVNVSKVGIMPQPFGTLLDVALDDDGEVQDGDVANGKIGVIDCGGKTTNMLSAARLGEIAKETASVNIGGWDVIRSLREHIESEYPNRDFQDHELAEVVRSGKFTYFGEKVDVKKHIETITADLARTVVSRASQLWNGGASLDKVVITGGGSHLLGKAICAHFPHAILHSNPLWIYPEPPSAGRRLRA